MKRLYDVGRILWLLAVAGFALGAYYAGDKIVGSHWFAGGLAAVLILFAWLAGAPGRPWFGSRLAMRHGKRRRLKSVWRGVNLFGLFFVVFGTCYTFFGFQGIERHLPDKFDEVSSYHPLLASRVYARDGQVIGEFFIEKRVIKQWSEIPPVVRQAFVAAEDKRFYAHHGIDLAGISRAAYTNVKAKRIKQGGSTITQQVAKLLIVGREKTFMRKIREAILARKIEKSLTKDRILAIYLNHAYLGHGAYGVGAAAEIYFGKDLSELTLAEAALIAGTPKAPTATSPFNDFSRARERQHYVLREMVDAGFITEREAAEARRETISIIKEKEDANWAIAPYFVEHIRKYVYRHYGKEAVFGGGLQIRTTLDLNAQLSAEAAVRAGLEELSRKLGFSGPMGTVPPAERERWFAAPRMHPEIPGMEFAAQGIALGEPYQGMIMSRRGKFIIGVGQDLFELDRMDVERIRRWASRKGNKLRDGDLIPVKIEERVVGYGKRKRQIRIATLVEAPTVQAALVALDVKTGEVRALVGGYDYHFSQFNRATQAKRQAGSSIKPFVYTTAVERGKTEADMVLDAPIAVTTASGVWAPHNYKGEFEGAVTLRTALAKSLNTVSVRLTLEAGVGAVMEYMRKMGLEKSVVPRHISISLGTPDVIPLEMSAAFASFPSGGKRVRPVFISRITTAEGRVLEETPSGVGEQVMAPETAFIMADMMQGVVLYGTGRKALELGRPAAGKTGTSTNFRDAWFIGYTADWLCGVWVGRDNFKPIGGDTTGGNTAAPIWAEFMKAAHPRTPIRGFTPPQGIVFVRVNRLSGERANPGDPVSVLMPFRRGTVPKHYFGDLYNKFSAEDSPESQPSSGPSSGPASEPASVPSSQSTAVHSE